MNNIRKKIAASILAVGVISLTSVGYIPKAFASNSDSSSKPMIREVKKRNTNSIVLPIRFEKKEKGKVDIKVLIENLKTGKKMMRDFKVKLDKGKEKKLVINNLKAGTEYRFRVRIKKSGESKFSGWSEALKVTTKK